MTSISAMSSNNETRARSFDLCALMKTANLILPSSLTLVDMNCDGSDNESIAQKLVHFAEGISASTCCQCQSEGHECILLCARVLLDCDILVTLRNVVTNGDEESRVWALRAALVLVSKLNIASSNCKSPLPLNEFTLDSEVKRVLKMHQRILFYVRPSFSKSNISYGLLKVMFEAMTGHVTLMSNNTHPLVCTLGDGIKKPSFISEILVAAGYSSLCSCSRLIDDFIVFVENPSNCDSINRTLPNWSSFVLRLLKIHTTFLSNEPVIQADKKAMNTDTKCTEMNQDHLFQRLASFSVILLTRQALRNSSEFWQSLEKYRRHLFVLSEGWTKGAVQMLRMALLRIGKRLKAAMNQSRGNFHFPFWHSLIFFLENVFDFVTVTSTITSTSAASHASHFGFHVDEKGSLDLDLTKNALALLRSIQDEEFDESINPTEDEIDSKNRMRLLQKIHDFRRLFQRTIFLLQNLAVVCDNSEWIALAAQRLGLRVRPVSMGNKIFSTSPPSLLRRQLRWHIEDVQRELAANLGLLRSFRCFKELDGTLEEGLIDVEMTHEHPLDRDEIVSKQTISMRALKSAPHELSFAARKTSPIPHSSPLCRCEVLVFKQVNINGINSSDARCKVVLEIPVKNISVLFSVFANFSHTSPKTGFQTTHTRIQPRNRLRRSLIYPLTLGGFSESGCLQCEYPVLVIQTSMPILGSHFLTLHFPTEDRKQRLIDLCRSLNSRIVHFDAKIPPILKPKSEAMTCNVCRRRLARFLNTRCRCRYCGEVFCTDCCSRRASLPEMGYPPEQGVRICSRCDAKRFDLALRNVENKVNALERRHSNK